RRMMLTTPPIASEPYRADAPSDRISIRSTAASGMVLRSAFSPVEGAYGTRRPSTSTRVRSEPMPRRSMSAVAWAELPERGRKFPNEEKVESRSTSASETSPLASMAARSMTVRGTAPSMSARRMRDPVTVRRSRVCAVSSGGVSCAARGSVARAQAMATGSTAHLRRRDRKGDVMGCSPDLVMSALNAPAKLRTQPRRRLTVHAGPVCRVWRARGRRPVTRRGHAEARTERAREAAVVLEAAGGAGFAHRQPRAAQQPRRVRQPHARGRGLRTLAVQRVEGLGEVPDRHVAAFGQFGQPHRTIEVAGQVQPGALHAREDLAPAALRTSGAAVDQLAQARLLRRQQPQHRLQ